MRYRKQWLIFAGLFFVISLLVCLVLVFAPSRVEEVRTGTETTIQEARKELMGRLFPAKVDPSDVWYVAFNLTQAGEAAEEKGDGLDALAKYEESKGLYDWLARRHPSFYPELVTYRRDRLQDSIHELQVTMNPK